MAEGKKLKHRCPALPEELGKVTAPGWNGEDTQKAKSMWFAWLRTLERQRPLSRKTY